MIRNLWAIPAALLLFAVETVALAEYKIRTRRST